MAYKDEYEVARLHVDTAFAAKVGQQFEGDYKIRFHLAPPLLTRTDPCTGRPAKISFGPWVLAVFKILTRMKSLRGTRFDPFGWTAERRTERRLLAEYFELVSSLATRLNPTNHGTAVALAQLPQEIRGFGPVKEAAIDKAEHKRLALLAKLDEPRMKKAS
jgi:indolepyruvate ferredoxin oxidoreductase